MKRSTKRQIEFKSTMELERAITYLEEMLQSIKDGTVSVESSDQRRTLRPSPIIQLEFEAKQKEDKEALSVELTWKDGLKVDRDMGLRISSHAAEASSMMSKCTQSADRDPILFRSFGL